MNRNFQPGKSNSPSDIWREFVQAELKNKSKIGTLLESAIYGGYENKSLTIYFADDAIRKNAQGQRDAIQKKLKDQFRGCLRSHLFYYWFCTCNFCDFHTS